MIVDRLKKNDNALLIVSPVLLLIFGISDMLFGSTELYVSSMQASLFGAGFESWNRILLVFINIFLALGAIVWCNQSCQSLGLFNSISNFPLLLGALLFGIIPTEINTPFTWLEVYLMIALMVTCFQLFTEKKNRESLFNASLLSGAISVLDLNLMPVVLIPITISAISGNISVRGLIIWLIGTALPMYLIIGILYTFSPSLIVQFGAQRNSPLFVYGYNSQTLTACTIILTAFSILIMVVNSKANSLSHRQKWHLILAFFIISLTPVFYARIGTVLALSFIPMVLVFTRFFTSKVNVFFKDIVILLLVTIAIFYQFV